MIDASRVGVPILTAAHLRRSKALGVRMTYGFEREVAVPPEFVARSQVTAGILNERTLAGETTQSFLMNASAPSN